VDSPQDLQKILVQITQNLSMIIRNKGFELRTFYISDKEKRGVHNSVDEVLKEIEKTINASIQRSLNQLEVDCKKLSDRIDLILQQDEDQRRVNAKARNQGFLFALLACLLPFVLMLSFVYTFVERVFDSFGPDSFLQPIGQTLASVGTAAYYISQGRRANFIAITILAFAVFITLSRLTWKQKSVLSKKEVANLREYQRYMKTNVMKQKEELYQQYFQQFVHDYGSMQ